jgi:argininosuccinate lyase
MRNSLDAVADRDFALDYLYALRGALRPLSRIGEELASGRRRSSGSPAPASRGNRVVDDAAEAEPGRRRARPRQGGHGDRPADRLLATVKGLPLAYNRDLQEDKRAACRRAQGRARGAGALKRARRGLRFDERRLEAAADPLLLATDAARGARRRGVPFRDAHEQVAERVREGAFDPDSTAAESVAARLGDVAAAVAAARLRFS